MENNREMGIQQQLTARKATAEKSVWNAKLFFEVLTVVAIIALMISIYILVGHQNPKDPEGPMSIHEWFDYYDYHQAQAERWLLITVMIGVCFCICAAITDRLDYYCGGYRCEKCGHIHVPAKKDVSHSFGMGNRRYLRCPACSQNSWQTKMLTVVGAIVDSGNNIS